MWEARSFIEMTSFKIPILSPVQLILTTSIDRKKLLSRSSRRDFNHVYVTYLSVSRENNSYNQQFLHNQRAQIHDQHSYLYYN